MPFGAVYLFPFRRIFLGTLTGLCLFLLASPTGSALGALVRTLEGGGNFHSYFEVINRWQDDGTLDVLVLVELSNADLTYKAEERGLVGRIRMEIELVPVDGEPISVKRPFRTASLVSSEANSRTLNQVFGLIIRDVPVREGRINVHVFDVNKYRPGIWNQYKRHLRRSEGSTDWYAENSPRSAGAVALGDPLFLFLAPLQQWDPSLQSHNETKGGFLFDYMHPSRRYGLEQDKLQVFIPVWPPEGGLMPSRMVPGLAVQITSMDMDFAINDTIDFDKKGQLALEAGRPSGLFYELDVNLLPQGSYRMTVAPLGGQGKGLSSGFDVVWRLDSLGRFRHLQMAEGHLVFQGSQLNEFMAASPAGRETLLDEYWDSLNPDPENPFNEVYLEFQARMAYVQRFLGGFNETGPVDDRGLVFVLLGPPDEIQREAMPMNFRDQDDAQIKVFKRFAPDREGVGSKGVSPEGGQSIDPYGTVGGIPMPYSERAVNQINSRANSATHSFGFELWKYDQSGHSLFENQFSRSTMGSRFLFLDRTGSGDFYLESSNIVQGEE